MSYKWEGVGSAHPALVGIRRSTQASPVLPQLQSGYCVAIGGDATAGRGVYEAWPQLLEVTTGRMVASFAAAHAGLDAMMCDRAMLRVAPNASLCLLEIPSAINFSNPYYRVHPRRNERLLQAEFSLRRLFPEVDFTEFSFTRHMILRLHQTDPQRFSKLSTELARFWLRRMEDLLAQLDAPTVLIWMGDRAPCGQDSDEGLGQGAPCLVSADMIEALRPLVRGMVQTVIRERGPDLSGEMGLMPCQQAHIATSNALVPWLAQLPPLSSGHEKRAP